MTTENPNAIAIESFVPSGQPPDGVAGVISPLGISGLGAGYDLSGGSQMDKMEVEANPHGVGDAPALVDVVNRESIPKPSFRDIVGGGIVADQRNNIIDSLDVSLTEDDVRYGHSKEVCGQTEAVTVPSAPGRSRFKELELLGEDNQRNASGMEQDSGREPNTQGMGTAVRVSNVVGEAEGSTQVVVKGVVHSTGGLREVVQVNPAMVDEGCDGNGDGHVEQPCQEEVVVSPRVDAKGNSRVLRENNGRPLYGSILSNYAKGVKRSSVASKAFPLKDLRSKKKNELGSALVVEDWASKFASSLNMGTMAVSSIVLNDVNNVVVGDANYEPRDENVSIEAKS
ncbi:hypothetical protein V6N11_077119 [Hibiscus sabdariffa]|uniref:Uncharacterized protein n=1 Tax=Hibiscus sabdariffa TaxID=183260 RepID=A0ABR2TC50_9ROSI